MKTADDQTAAGVKTNPMKGCSDEIVYPHKLTIYIGSFPAGSHSSLSRIAFIHQSCSQSYSSESRATDSPHVVPHKVSAALKAYFS